MLIREKRGIAMKLQVDNLKDLLGTYIKPIASFISVNAIEEPVMRLIAENNKLLMESASHDKSIKVSTDATVSDEGSVYIKARSMTAVRSSHKKALLSNSGGKLTIKSGDKKRKLVLDIDTVDESSYPVLNSVKGKSESLGKVSLETLNMIVSRLNITPILIPGQSKCLISIQPKPKGYRIIVHDDHRVLAMESSDQKTKFKSHLITDFKELQNVIKLISALAEEAEFSFTKRSILATGFDEDEKDIIDINVNYSIPGTEYVNRALSIYKASLQSKPSLSFSVDKTFIEVLENVISLTNIRSAGVANHMEISLSKGFVTISGSGPASSYNESLKVDDAQGKGTVRMNTNSISDLTRSFSEKSVFRVTKQAVLIINKWKDNTIYFILPFLNFSEKVK